MDGARPGVYAGFMSLLLNLLWIIFGGGFLIWLEYLLAGVLLCLTVVGIPFGLQCFKIASLGLFPFGKDIEREPSIDPPPIEPPVQAPSEKPGITEPPRPRA